MSTRVVATEAAEPQAAVPTRGWQEWTMDDLMDLKSRGNHRVSLVVPARDEADTVGALVSRLRQSLMETVTLVDEIVVIDSDSQDQTYQVAKDAGAATYRAAEVGPDLGAHRGKGEAMWKSLFVTSGDLIVFMDADLVEWDTHFVPGLLGPLLESSKVELVKGIYERPFNDHSGQTSLEGGRVTELVARPLIALLFPHLAGIVQPLAGEWSVRRSMFERLSVPTGYGVEIAALIDVAGLAGIESIAQVHLGRRGHRHQPLLDLAAMAVQVMAAAMSRTPQWSDRPDTATLQQFDAANDGVGIHQQLVSLAERSAATEVQL